MAQTIDGRVAVVVVEACELKNAVPAHLAICSEFLVPAVLQHRAAIPHEQSRERVQLVQSRRQHGVLLGIRGFQRPKRGGHRSKNQLGIPTLRNLVVKLCARTQGGGRGAKSDQNIFAAVAQQQAIAERQGTALIQSHTAEVRPIGPDLGFS